MEDTTLLGMSHTLAHSLFANSAAPCDQLSCKLISAHPVLASMKHENFADSWGAVFCKRFHLHKRLSTVTKEAGEVLSCKHVIVSLQLSDSWETTKA